MALTLLAIISLFAAATIILTLRNFAIAKGSAARMLAALRLNHAATSDLI